ncbi:MAG: translation initiation factor IF-2 associated domain-containing protein, partial [Alphaproteobacteria bacterium]|nr:translation initiation factor IF-2 associated domain-containing protein [Alphaproteobacteria bacterium]
MSETTEKSKSSKLSLSRPGKLELKKTVESGAVRQNFSHGRSKMVQVERKTKRTFALDSGGRMAEVKARKTAEAFEEVIEEVAVEAPPPLPPSVDEEKSARTLTKEEKAARQRALEEAKKYEDERKVVAERDAARREAVKAAAEAEVAAEDE